MNKKKKWGLHVMLSNPLVKECPVEWTYRCETKKQAMDKMNTMCDEYVSGKIDIGEDEITSVEKLTRYCTMLFSKLCFCLEFRVCKV